VSLSNRGEATRLVPFDNLDRARKLRAKAADLNATTPAEREMLLEKARELEAKHRKLNPPPTDNTTTFTGDSFWLHGAPPPKYSSTEWNEAADTLNDARMKRAAKIAQDLLDNQWRWNTEYYDKDGNPVQARPDVDDIYEEDYKYEPEE
jgi:hypothetical protein